jgi:DNA mismatch repair ATPase MutL
MINTKLRRNPSFPILEHVLAFPSFADIEVLRSLGFFSHLTITSQHHTYRQAYTLTLSSSLQYVHPTPSTRSMAGTTVTIKDLFANYPVRKLLSQSRKQSEMTDLRKVSIGIALSTPLALTLRSNTGEKLIKINRTDAKDWEKDVLEKGLSCRVLRCLTFDNRDQGVRVILRIYTVDTSKNHTFICTTSS